MDKTQAQAENPATAAPEPEAETTEPTLEGASLEDLDAVQTEAAKITSSKPAGSGEEVKAEEQPKAEEPPKTEEGEKPKEEEPAEVAAQAEPEPEPAPEPEPESEPEEPRGELPERFRFKNPTDRAIAAVFKAAEVNGTPISWAEAEKRVKGESTTAPPSDPVIAISDTIATLQGEIAELEKQIDPEDEDEILSTKAMRKATVELTRKRAELNKAEIALENVQTGLEMERQNVVAQQRNAREESKKRAIAEYPDAANADTLLGKAIAKRFEELKNPRHRNHPILFADDAPELVTEIVAKELGIAPKAKTTAPTTKPATTTPAQVKATPVSGKKTSVPEKPAEAKDNKKSEAYLLSDEATLDEMDQAVGGDVGLAAAVR